MQPDGAVCSAKSAARVTLAATRQHPSASRRDTCAVNDDAGALRRVRLPLDLAGHAAVDGRSFRHTCAVIRDFVMAKVETCGTAFEINKDVVEITGDTELLDDQFGCYDPIPAGYSTRRGRTSWAISRAADANGVRGRLHVQGTWKTYSWAAAAEWLAGKVPYLAALTRPGTAPGRSCYGRRPACSCRGSRYERCEACSEDRRRSKR